MCKRGAHRCPLGTLRSTRCAQSHTAKRNSLLIKSFQKKVEQIGKMQIAFMHSPWGKMVFVHFFSTGGSSQTFYKKEAYQCGNTF